MTSCKPPPTCIDASPIPDANDSRMSAIPYEANLTPMRAALRLTRDARLALQAEPEPTPPHPGAEAQGHELARLRREPAPAWQLDGLVFGRGGRGVGGRAAHEPGRAARVFRPGDPDGADVQGRVPAGVPADRRADRLRHRPTRARPRRAGPHHPVPPGRDA